MLNNTLKVFKKKKPLVENMLDEYKKPLKSLYHYPDDKPIGYIYNKNSKETLTIFSSGVFDINGKRVYISDGKIIHTE